jgi:hypothetical protein
MSSDSRESVPDEAIQDHGLPEVIFCSCCINLDLQPVSTVLSQMFDSLLSDALVADAVSFGLL